ncbi:MAG: hypothetical protein KDM91_12710 [Verrucomicrobiae bacterium]|nr:hypothetical protein [Verrucomicrobiae bacterium]MCP5541000.1 hypothetical protein [Akkermansiaceae bacterium]
MSRNPIAMPDAGRGWDLWSGGRVKASGEEPGEVAGSGADVVIGVPATLATTFAVKLPTLEESLFEPMVYAQIEKRGLGAGGPEATAFAWWVVQQEGNETLLSVDVLPADFPETLCVEHAAGYAPAARLWRLPEDKLLFWIEHGRGVLAANRHGRLTHVQVLTAPPELGAATAQEINLTALTLQAQGFVGENPELVVAGDFSGPEGGDRAGFEGALTLPVDYLPGPGHPTAPPQGMRARFVPQAVKDARARRATRRKVAAFALAAAAVYVAIGALLWMHARSTRRTIELLEARASENRPTVEEIQRTEQRWRELEPAIDLRYYPLVQLNEVTKAMPGSGVLLREFETRGTSIFVRGAAKDVQMAFTLVEDLKKSPELSVYEWNMPKPKVESNSSATFEIQGKPKHAGTDE